MPRGDRTGPNGEGPQTGRKMGYCSGSDTPGYATPGPGMGLGRGSGRGMGRGFGRGLGRGFGPGLGFGRGRRRGPARCAWPYEVVPVYYRSSQGSTAPAGEEEAAYLESALKGLEEEAKWIKDRLAALKEEVKK